MRFSSPITSMCMSLSGEYLCLTLADTEGIQMYLDRSLYETVHFWKEPTEPIFVEECRVKSEAVVQDNTAEEDDDGDNSDDEEKERPVVISAVQAQIDNSESSEAQKAKKEDLKQRGAGSITMAALPKAYWLTLFNLEGIKERNKPVAPPTAPPQAPFFLPTVVKNGDGGIAPAFPTPAEYAKLTTSAPQSAESQTKETLDPLKQLSSSWQDDDGDGAAAEDGGEDDDWGDSNWNESTVAIPLELGAAEGSQTGKKRKQEPVYQSRIIRRNVELPR
jgi:hypothetical protein